MRELKLISKSAIPRALDLAERYRLLNEPEQAASICHDVLAAEPGNTVAIRTLFLATTEQFHHKHGTTFEDADKLVDQLSGEYEQLYHHGIACERWARARLQSGGHVSMVGDWLHRAMDLYERAGEIRPSGNDDAMLRWNACVRLLDRMPGYDREKEHASEFGD